jgi:hypothetical protein
MTNTTNWSDLAGFSIGGDLQETSFNDSIGKASFDVGLHKDVKITAVEPRMVVSSKDGTKYASIKISVENADGAKMNHDVFLTDKEGNMGFGLRNLLSSLTSDKTLLMNFGNAIKRDLTLLSSLAGMYTSFVVSKPTKGAEIISSNGEIIARDIEDGTEYGRFGSFKEASDFLKENGFRRGYNSISSFKSGCDNTATINSILESLSNSKVQPLKTARRQTL